MKTELVFRLENEPAGYGNKFSPNCKIDIKNTKGVLYLDYSKRHPVGMFENLRSTGELILADVEIFQNFKEVEHRFEYAIEGNILKKNDQNECEEVQINSVGVLMPPKD
jgi:hypothetical protein